MKTKAENKLGRAVKKEDDVSDCKFVVLGT